MEKTTKKRILEVSIVSHNTGGVEKFLYDVFMHLDTGIFDIDFLSPDGGSYEIFREDIEKKGGKLLDLGVDRESTLGKVIYGVKLYRFLKKNKYDIVHINSGAFLFCFQVATIARLCRQKRVIVHSHSTIRYGHVKSVIIHLLKPLLEKEADDLLACSKDAAQALFTKKSISTGRAHIIPNGIEAAQFSFSETDRIKYRNELNPDDYMAYVHVGRFVYEKNHEFLIDVFSEIQKIQNNAILFLVGDGPRKDGILEKVKQNKIEDKVVFMGLRDDVCHLLNAMDVFIFPSIWEGLGIVAIEAQTNGLYTICSDGVPDEAAISDLYKMISLKKTPEEWAKTIVEYSQKGVRHRSSYYTNTIDKGLDISNTAKAVSDVYLNN